MLNCYFIRQLCVDARYQSQQELDFFSAQSNRKRIYGRHKVIANLKVSYLINFRMIVMSLHRGEYQPFLGPRHRHLFSTFIVIGVITIDFIVLPNYCTTSQFH